MVLTMWKNGIITCCSIKQVQSHLKQITLSWIKWPLCICVTHWYPNLWKHPCEHWPIWITILWTLLHRYPVRQQSKWVIPWMIWLVASPVSHPGVYQWGESVSQSVSCRLDITIYSNSIFHFVPEKYYCRVVTVIYLVLSSFHSASRHQLSTPLFSLSILKCTLGM